MNITHSRNEAVTLDSETVGLHGVMVLLQYAQGDDEVTLFSPWTNPIRDTLRLLEAIATNPGGIILFNGSFDWFHCCKLYCIFSAYHDHDAIPITIIDELAELEMAARDGSCLKPVKVCDVMLVARRGVYQNTMDRSDIRIRRVPSALAWQLADELERRIPLKDIYFARRKNKNAPHWTVADIEDGDGGKVTDFKDIVLKFQPSSALKALAVDALQLPVDEVLLFRDVGVDSRHLPEEFGYAPFAKAVGGGPGDWRGAWPEKIEYHVEHWCYNELAREYAKKDVEYTRSLYKFFGSPKLGDDDSELACMVGAVRWRGFRIDVEKLKRLTALAKHKMVGIPTAPAQVRAYINMCLDPTERLVLQGTTAKIALEELAELEECCPACNREGEVNYAESETEEGEETLVTQIGPGKEGCERCGGRGAVEHRVAVRAKQVLDARAGQKEIELYEKLIKAGRFHASLKVIGALSSRMSGADGLNPQGINKAKEVRSSFPLAWDDLVGCGGDFAAYEVTIAEAVYGDDNLRKMLLTCERCDERMDCVVGPIKVRDYLSESSYTNYLKDRSKEEAKKQKKDSTYIPVSFDVMQEEELVGDFICPACGNKDAKKIHALFGLHCYPGHTYESLKATSGTGKGDLYTRAKSAVFALFYGGTEFTLAERLGVPTEIGLKALASFHKEFPGVRRFQQDIFNAMCSMRQPGGIGTKVEWHEPADYRETMFGFRRYFTLENQICRALFDLANKPPRSWQEQKIRVMRRDRFQTASGAVQSSLYGAAFQIQAANMRAAANHDIQSAGATITKGVQRKIWDIQPAGVGPWLVMPLNIHDEVMAPCRPDVAERVRVVVREAVESYRPKIPLIKMEWVVGLKTWAEKG